MNSKTLKDYERLSSSFDNMLERTCFMQKKDSLEDNVKKLDAFADKGYGTMYVAIVGEDGKETDSFTCLDMTLKTRSLGQTTKHRYDVFGDLRKELNLSTEELVSKATKTPYTGHRLYNITEYRDLKQNIKANRRLPAQPSGLDSSDMQYE